MSRKNHPLYNRWKNMRRERVPEWDDFTTFITAVEGGFGDGLVLSRIDRLLPFGPDNIEWMSAEAFSTGASNPNYKDALAVSACEFCAKPMVIYKDRPGKFCSRRCQAGSQRKAKLCTVCKEPFLEGFNQYTCSLRCAELRELLEEERAEQKSTEDAVRRRYGVYIWKLCQICGARMQIRPSDEKKNRRFCSRTCYGKFVGLRQAGEKHHMWKGGVSAPRDKVRTSKLYAEWRVKVFERDEYACQSCFEVGGKLRAHHIAPFKDNPKLRLKVKNGITLCEVCHKQWHVFNSKGLFAGLERDLQRKAMDRFREAGFFVFNVHGGPLQAAGIPDNILSCFGLFVAVEYKVFPNFLTPLQKTQMKAIKNAAGMYYMCRSEDDVERIINDVYALAETRS